MITNILDLESYNIHRLNQLQHNNQQNNIVNNNNYNNSYNYYFRSFPIIPITTQRQHKLTLSHQQHIATKSSSRHDHQHYHNNITNNKFIYCATLNNAHACGSNRASALFTNCQLIETQGIHLLHNSANTGFHKCK